MFKAPIQTHSGLKIKLTNTFGPIKPDSLAAWYMENYGIKEHSGIDLVLWGKRSKSYGTPILSLFDGKVYYEQFYSRFGRKANGLRIESLDGQWRARYWHNSKHLVRWGDTVEQYQPIALMGNTGIVKPDPTYKDPYGGTHLHLTLEMKISGMWIKVDPLQHINLSDTIDGPDTGVNNDTPPLAWVIAEAKDMVYKLAIKIGLLRLKQQGYEE